MRGDWGYAPTSEYDGAFMRRNTPLATLLTTVRTRLSHGSAPGETWAGFFKLVAQERFIIERDLSYNTFIMF